MAAEVNARSAAVSAMQPTWEVIDALLGGTPAMRLKGITYLPKQPREEQDDYDYRVKVSTLFPAYRRTVSVMAGKPFSKELTLSAETPVEIAGRAAKDGQPEIEGWAADIDREGVNLHTFGAEMFAESFYGLCGIIVDTPRMIETAGPVATKAEQAQAGVRPYFVRVKHGQILGWKVDDSTGSRRLVQLRIAETKTVEDGRFGEKTVERVRVMEPGLWEVWEKQATKGTDVKDVWLLQDSGKTDRNYIPFVPVYGHRLGFMAGAAPLADLAYLNVKHWQSQSDQDESTRYSRKRLLVAIGIDNENPIVASSSYALQLPAGADMKVVQGSAEAVTVGRAELAALEDQMIQAGAELLVKKPGARTATESANDQEGNLCDLQRMVEGFEDSLDAALWMMADSAKLPMGGSVNLFKDYGAGTLSDASAQLIVSMWQAGLLSRETAISELKRRGLLSPEITAKLELDMIAVEPPALGVMTDSTDPTADPQDDPQDDAA